MVHSFFINGGQYEGYQPTLNAMVRFPLKTHCLLASHFTITERNQQTFHKTATNRQPFCAASISATSSKRHSTSLRKVFGRGSR